MVFFTPVHIAVFLVGLTAVPTERHCPTCTVTPATAEDPTNEDENVGGQAFWLEVRKPVHGKMKGTTNDRAALSLAITRCERCRMHRQMH